MSNSYSLRGRRPLPSQDDISPGGNFRQNNRGGNYNNNNNNDQNKRTKYDSSNKGNVAKGNATSILYLGNVPKDWNDDIIQSVVKGSGNIVDIRARIDPSGRSKNYVFVEYQTPDQASRAMSLLSAITFNNRRFKVEQSKEGFKAGMALRTPLQLNRNFLPPYVKLPPEMLAEDFGNNPSIPVNANNVSPGLNQRPGPPPPFQRPGPPGFNRSQPPSFNNTQAPPSFNHTQAPPPPPSSFQQANQAAVKQEQVIPDILARATETLPGFNTSTFTTNEKISQNLSAVNPPAMIQMISLLKNSDEQTRQAVLNTNPSYTVAVVQSLLAMGIIDKATLQTVLGQSDQQNTPVQQNAIPVPQQQQQQQPPSFRQTPQPPRHQDIPAHTSDPRYSNLPASTIQMLSTMDPEQAKSLTEILTMPQAQINALPSEHRDAIMNLRSKYL